MTIANEKEKDRNQKPFIGNCFVFLCRQGSVVVDFDLRHTVYMPGDSLHGVDAMRAILWRHLEDGRLGQYRANTENFHFRRKGMCQ